MTNQDNSNEKNEKILETGIYRGCKINVTNFGRFLVEVLGAVYPAVNLAEAKKIIDDYLLTKAN